MAQVKFDSELMKQLIPAAPIPQTAHFGVVYGEQNRPMIFSIGNDGVFYLIVSGPDGKNHLVNLSSKFKLNTDALTFAISQDVDHTIYLVFAQVGSGPEGHVYVMMPKKPTEVDWIGSNDLTPILLKGESKALAVQQIFLGNNDDGKGFPLSVVVFKDLSRESIDIIRIAVDLSANSWAFKTDLILPENAAKMTHMCVGSLRSARGLFVLYEIQSSYSLKFVGVRTPRGTIFSTDLVVPPGARSLASFTNPEGYTDLLVGGDGLYHFTSKAASHSGSQGTLVTSGALFQGLRQVYIAKADQHISVWAENKDNQIVYQLMNLDTSDHISVRTTPIPLLSRAPGSGRFAASLDPSNGSQQFFMIEPNNRLLLLEQSGSTRLWQTTLVAVPAIAKNVEFSSYTSHINFTDSNGKPLPYINFLLSSSGWTSITVNGRVYSVGQAGIPVTTDSLGNITIILAVNDICSHIFTIKDLPGGHVFGGQTHIVNPSKKIIDGLAKIKSGNDLRNAKLKNGQPLLSGSIASDGDINKVAEIISQLNDALSKMGGDGISVYSVSTANAVLWDFWHWIEDQFNKVTRWVVEAAADVWLFVIEIGGEVLKFVLDSVTHVLKAISWVMKNVLGIDVEKFIQWLGFIFEWDDILNTHKRIVEMTNEAISWGAENVASFTRVVDDFFLGLKDTVRNLTLPTSLKDTKLSETQPSGGEVSEFINTPGGNWSNYQLEHGSITSISLCSDIGQTDPVTNLWRDILKPILDSLENTASNIGEDLFNLFKTNSDFTVGELFEKLGSDVLVGFIEALRIMSNGLIRVLADVLCAFKDVINTPINIPLFTPLYKLISGGLDLTVVDAVALLIAIPSTIAYKVVKGRKLSGLPAWKTIINTQPSSLAFTNTTADLLSAPSLLKEYTYVSGVISPITALYSTVLDTMKWASPTLDLTKLLDKWDVAIGFIGVAFSFPLSSTPKPGIGYQVASWSLGGLHQIVKLVLRIVGSNLPKAVTDKLGGVAKMLVSVGQLVLQIITTVLEALATEEEFPDKDGTSITLKVGNAVLSSSGKAIQGLGKIVGPENPEASGIMIVLGVGLTVIGSGVAFARLAKDIQRGTYFWVVDA